MELDPGQVAGGTFVAGVAVGRLLAKDGIFARVLGPSADSVGNALQRWTDARIENATRVLENAAGKIADLDDGGRIPSRVAYHVLDEGSFCDDDVMVEYLGGVLASGRTTVTRDDRGAKWVQVVTQLSAYDVRLHYLFYASARRALIRSGRRYNWRVRPDVPELAFIALPYSDVVEAMEFNESEMERGNDLVGESVWTLVRHDLIDHNFFLTSEADFQRQTTRFLNSPSGVVRVTPSVNGIRLFLNALGRGALPIDAFDDPEADLNVDGEFPRSEAYIGEDLPELVQGD